MTTFFAGIRTRGEWKLSNVIYHMPCALSWYWRARSIFLGWPLSVFVCASPWKVGKFYTVFDTFLEKGAKSQKESYEKRKCAQLVRCGDFLKILTLLDLHQCIETDLLAIMVIIDINMWFIMVRTISYSSNSDICASKKNKNWRNIKTFKITKQQKKICVMPMELN